jgi:hypothetical protein
MKLSRLMATLAAAAAISLTVAACTDGPTAVFSADAAPSATVRGVNVAPAGLSLTAATPIGVSHVRPGKPVPASRASGYMTTSGRGK